jgi:hypothetical protein
VLGLRYVAGGFLAGWPGLPGNDNHATFVARIKFGITIALQFPPKVAAVFVAYLATFTAEYAPLSSPLTSLICQVLAAHRSPIL